MAVCRSSSNPAAPLFLNEFVGVEPAGEANDLGLHPLGLKNVERAQNGVLAGVIAVVSDVYKRHIALHQAGLLGRERRAQRGHRAHNARLREADDIHVPFYQHQTARAAPPQAVEPVKVIALVEHRRVRRVEVLGLFVAHGPAAKANDLLIGADDGKHHPAAEHVEPRRPPPF